MCFLPTPIFGRTPRHAPNLTRASVREQPPGVGVGAHMEPLLPKHARPARARALPESQAARTFLLGAGLIGSLVLALHLSYEIETANSFKQGEPETDEAPAAATSGCDFGPRLRAATSGRGFGPRPPVDCLTACLPACLNA